jgi:uncharacterized membrane protein YdjX (TVP38/TMEM64 family)
VDKGKIKQLIIKISALSILVIVGIFLAIKYTPDFLHLAANPDNLKTLLSSYGVLGILIFILIQIIQVIIAFLPGELTQLAGGYIYGTFMGTLYSMTGITLGSIIVFFTSRFLGDSLLNLFMSKERFEKFSFLINSPKSEMIMFILFLIPGMPKDSLSYLAGITPVKPVNFLVVSSLARFPALFVSSYVGANLQQGNFTTVIIVVLISCSLIAAGFFMKDKIFRYLHRDLPKENQLIKQEVK